MLDSIRDFALTASRVRPRRRRLARPTPRGSPRPPIAATRPCAARTARVPVRRPSRTRQHRHRARLVRRSRPAAGVRIAVGFGWAWVVHGDGVAGATRVRAHSRRPDRRTPPVRATGLLLAGWLETSAGNLDQARTRSLRGARPGRAGWPTTCSAPTPSATWRSCASRRAAPDLRSRLATAALTVYRPLGLDWQVATQPRPRGVRLEHARRSTGATTVRAIEAVDLLTSIGDSWALVQPTCSARSPRPKAVSTRPPPSSPAPPRRQNASGSSGRPPST